MTQKFVQIISLKFFQHFVMKFAKLSYLFVYLLIFYYFIVLAVVVILLPLLLLDVH